MFDKQIQQFKEYFRPYIQPIPAEDVFIGTIIFYVIFSLAFFMSDHSNIDFAANTIMFYNSWIIFCAVVLYFITANMFCAVIILSSFIANSLAELILGTLYYPSRMGYLTAYLHHTLYSAIMIGGIYYNLQSLSLAVMSSFIELSAIFQSIKHIWKVKNMVFDIVSAAVFFITRIVLWIPILFAIYMWCSTPAEVACTALVSCFTGVHIFWSYNQIQNLIRKYFSNEKTSLPPIGKII